MKRCRGIVPVAMLLVAPFWGSRQAMGAESVGVHVFETSEVKSLRIVVHPATEPRPALKYQLLPEFLDRIPGNAAVHYGKVTAEQQAVFGSAKVWENVEKWRTMPLDDLCREEIPPWLLDSPASSGLFGSLDRAARSEYCDWQLPIREGNFYSILIPEAQQMRSFARLLAVRARVQIANGRFDEAVHTLQTGYAVGQHAGEAPTLIHGLIGLAVSGIMTERVLELAQQPDAPNLYWALTMLPRPLVSGRQGIEAEMNAVALTFPELRDLEDATRSPEYWRDSLREFGRKLARFSSDSYLLQRPEVVTALAIKGYPMAKRALIDRGLSPEQVEAMPVPQVVLLYTVETYEELRDDIFKWFYVPYWAAREGMEKAEENLHQSLVEGREIVPLARGLLPAIGAFHSATARTDRDVAVLRTIEALRMYAAAHDGRLPEKLSSLTVPVPVDPITGQPFSYQLDGETAVLEGPPLPGLLLRVEVKVAR